MADREVGYDTVVKERRGDMGSQKWMLRSNLIVMFRMLIFSIYKNRVLYRLLVKKCSITSTLFQTALELNSRSVTKQL